MGRAPYVALHPPEGAVAYRIDDERPIELSPRRWGSRMLGSEKVGLMSPWASYRWGPLSVPPREMFVLPTLDPSPHRRRGAAADRADRRPPVASRR